MMFVDVKQNTDEWRDLRVGKITSSKLNIVMANYGKSFGEPAKKYATILAVERITKKSAQQNFTNEHMERGHIQEPIARMKYEETFFCDVSNGGFFDFHIIGCSPDGLVGNDGLIEIKSVIAPVHYSNLIRNNVDPAYKWQCYANLWLTGREYLDFVSYCEEFPEDYQLFVYRINIKDLKDEISMLDQRISDFNRLINERKEHILNSQYINLG